VNTIRETWRFDTRHVGRRVYVYASVSSTNDLAAELARDPENAGVVVLAEHQSAGRGQYGRMWNSRPGCSLLASVLLFPPADLNRPVILTAWAAVAVSKAIRRLTGLETSIKWPNDLLIQRKKVCGILIEQQRGTVVGIGLNLNQSVDDFSAAGLPDAGSLAIAAGSPIDLPAAAQVLFQQLDTEYEQILSGNRQLLESDWKRQVGLLGRHVTAELADGIRVSGRLREMGFDGLELELGEGVFRVVTPEAVRQLREA
jgi:BirA family biotin operon repressor/biotin-[acetyl-CoA-carboxylase] ligase